MLVCFRQAWIPPSLKLHAIGNTWSLSPRESLTPPEAKVRARARALILVTRDLQPRRSAVPVLCALVGTGAIKSSGSGWASRRHLPAARCLLHLTEDVRGARERQRRREGTGAT